MSYLLSNISIYSYHQKGNEQPNKKQAGYLNKQLREDIQMAKKSTHKKTFNILCH